MLGMSDSILAPHTQHSHRTRLADLSVGTIAMFASVVAVESSMAQKRHVWVGKGNPELEPIYPLHLTSWVVAQATS